MKMKRKKEDISRSGAVDGVRAPRGSNPERHRGTILPDHAQGNKESGDAQTDGDEGGGNLYGNPVRRDSVP
jgi:hypothetical protein